MVVLAVTALKDLVDDLVSFSPSSTSFSRMVPPGLVLLQVPSSAQLEVQVLVPASRKQLETVCVVKGAAGVKGIEVRTVLTLGSSCLQARHRMDKEINNRKCEVLLEGRSGSCHITVSSVLPLAADETALLQVPGVKVEEHRGWRRGSAEEE